jgi:toxin HigB-1
MIRVVYCRALKRLYEQDDASRLPQDMVPRIASILAALDSAGTTQDMDRPSLKLHPLKGNRQGQWAVTVRANWRITFSMSDGNAFDVDFEDYH